MCELYFATILIPKLAKTCAWDKYHCCGRIQWLVDYSTFLEGWNLQVQFFVAKDVLLDFSLRYLFCIANKTRMIAGALKAAE